MRLLLTWLQFHPGLGQTGRIDAGAQVAAGDDNRTIERPFTPRAGGTGVGITLEDLNAKMAATPPSSVAALLELAAACVATVEGFPVSVQDPEPPIDDDE